MAKLVLKQDRVLVQAEVPRVQLEGQEVGAKNLSIRENAGVIEVYEEGVGVVLTLEDHSARHENGGGDEISVAGLSGELADGQVPKDTSVTYAKLDTNTKRSVHAVRIPADSAAGDLWERALFYANTAFKVITAGIIPDVGFGQATDYAILEIQNKGTSGAGTTSLVSKNFDAAVSAFDFTSFGTISNEDVSADEVLSVKKTIASAGQVVPASLIVLVLERSA